MFENGVLRRIFEAKRGEGIGDWRNLYNEGFNILYCALNIIRMIKSRRTR
jgi:hypothetical protein